VAPLAPGWPQATGAGERPALLAGDACWSHDRLADEAGWAAAHLHARGLLPGDVLLWPALRTPSAVALHLGALRLGAISAPFNPLATPDELRHLRADSAARLLVEPGWLPRAAPPPAVPADDARDALLLYTSGTTGTPKGVPLTHGALHANLAALHSAWGWSDRDVLLHALPLFHVHGLVVALHGALFAGAACVLLERFDAAAVPAELARRRATLFMGVPTMYHRLAALPPGGPDTSGVRLWTCGSAPLRQADRAAFRARFGAEVLERYGLSEGLMLASQPLDAARRPGTVGRALPGVSLRVVERDTRRPLPPGQVGEVEARGPSVFRGYWHAPGATAGVLAPDGWLRTGDLGQLDADGTLTLAGRCRDLILSGGFNVYPLEVEGALAGHPDVAECAVFGLPDADLGEVVAAAVVPAAGRVPSEPALREHARERLAPHKVPRRWLLLPELPRTALGKVNRAALAAQAAAAGGGAHG
jgi:malonyl-CoA/methylmalonyl-CoA synthetase